jgi:signal transduction histidine kinase
MKLDPQPRDLVKLVDELSDFFHPQATQHAVVLRTQLPRDPIIARVDEGLLKQAVLNLMLNATQAMSGGGSGQRSAVSNQPKAPNSELILRVEGDESEARIHVIDTGPGIDTAKLNEIFRPYVTGRPGGTGLGLPTARRIVQEHGGELNVHSESDKGSDFTIHLPLEIK